MIEPFPPSQQLMDLIASSALSLMGGAGSGDWAIHGTVAIRYTCNPIN